jgi:hypothetical protein
MLVKLFALACWYAIAILMQIGVMIYGWGLEPQSWWWIIGIGFFGLFGHLIIGSKLTESFEEEL